MGVDVDVRVRESVSIWYRHTHAVSHPALFSLSLRLQVCCFAGGGALVCGAVQFGAGAVRAVCEAWCAGRLTRGTTDRRRGSST